MEFMVWREHIKFSGAGCHSLPRGLLTLLGSREMRAIEGKIPNLGRQGIQVTFSSSCLTGKFSFCILHDILPPL